jgi:Papain family cysteine protease/IPT/TIG domain/Family of unknown function (DUF5719)
MCAGALVGLSAALPAQAFAADSPTIGPPLPGGGAPRTMGFVRTTSGDYPRARTMDATAASVPPALDLTNAALPVGSQGQQSSCVAWTVAYYYKSLQEAREHGWDVSRADRRFSPSFLYNQINGGRDRGASFPSAFELLKDTGALDLNAMPYNQYDYTTQPNSQQVEAAKPYRIANYAYIWRGAGGNDVNQIKAHIAAGDPVALGIPVYQAFYYCQGNWVGSPAPGETIYGNHGICAVGYDDSAGGGQGGIKIVNSWGSDWGAGGYTYLSYDFVANYCWEAWTMTDRASDKPAVSSLSPASGAIDSEVTITGDNFGTFRGESKVKFNGTQASVIGWDNDTVKAKVPEGASDGNVTVTNWIGEVSNGKAFDVGMGLTGVAPGVAKPADRVAVYGRELGTGGTLKFNSTTLDVLSWSDSKIEFAAPATIGNGTIKAYVGGKVSNGVPFSVVASTWYLAEGCTNGGFETWVLVQNPNSKAANVNVTFMTPSGTVQGPQVSVPANARQTFNVADTVPGQWEVSTRVTADRPVFAERAMYGNNRAWGSESIGVESPESTWYLAEGSTGNGFETWVLVQNPNSTTAHVMLNYMTEQGKVEGPYVTLAANSRKTFNVADTVPNVDGVSTTVSADRPVIAERSVYWANRKGGTDSVGVTSPAKTWYLAEGSTGEGFETWVPVMNPGSKDARVRLTYMTERGEVPGPVVTIKAGTRRAFHVADTVPNTWSVSTTVTSDQPVVVERSVYWSGRVEGHESVGVTEAAETWYMPEGSTGPGFETWILVQNPNDKPVQVDVNYMTPKGEVRGPAVKLPANSRKTFFVADTVPDQWQVSTRVTADGPVIAERSMYGSGRIWGHDSVGIPK